MTEGEAMIDHLLTRPVTSLGLRSPVCVAPDARVNQAVVGMREHGQGAVLVLSEEGELQGLFTERDLLYRVDEGDRDFTERRISTFMQKNPTTISPTQTIADAIAMMDKGGFRHLPIIDAKKGPLGIVSVGDVLTHLVEAFPEVFVNLPPNPRSY